MCRQERARRNMNSTEVAIARRPALARGSWTGNAAAVERNRRQAARLQAARPSNAPPYGPILGCCAYAAFWATARSTRAPLVCGRRACWRHGHRPPGGHRSHDAHARRAGQPVRAGSTRALPARTLRWQANFAVTFGKLWAGQLHICASSTWTRTRCCCAASTTSSRYHRRWAEAQPLP